MGGPIACQDAEGFLVKFGGEMGTLYQNFTPCTPNPQVQTGIYLILGGPKACQDAEGFFTGGFPETYMYTNISNVGSSFWPFYNEKFMLKRFYQQTACVEAKKV